MDIIETLIIIGIASVIGFVSDRAGPQEYHYENRIVSVYKKYQCPNYCQVDHFHYVYFDSLMINKGGMCIDKEQLGERYKEDTKEEV